MRSSIAFPLCDDDTFFKRAHAKLTHVTRFFELSRAFPLPLSLSGVKKHSVILFYK